MKYDERVVHGDDVLEMAYQKMNAFIADVDGDLNALQTSLIERIRGVNMNTIDLALEVEILKGATLSGVTANVLVESFVDLNDITLTHGKYVPSERKVIIP